ncbi:MAG: S41 family peptidase [Bacteroidota bacterium]|nr:S41 family peptidase [Bacteroidota bacterium]
MGYKNKKTSIYLPILLSVILVAGIYFGIHLERAKVSGYNPQYFQITKLNGILNFVEAEYVDSVDLKNLEEAAIPAMLSQLDPHSIYIPALDVARVNEPLEGNFEGIGVSFNMPDDTIVIISVIPRGPSEKVGILAGDRIVKIEDEIVAGLNINSDDIVKKLKGPRGTKVIIGVKRKSVDEILYFTITRDKIPLYSVDVSYMANDSTGFIKISKFARTTYNEFMDALEDLKSKGMTQLILDLRGNSGGYLDAATNIANQFLPEGALIVYTEGRAHGRENTLTNGAGKFQKGKILILINEWSASASEIIAGAIQDNDRGIIMGRRSFGKGLVQEPLVLNDGSMIRLTIARYYTPTGRCIQKSYSNGNDDYYQDLHSRYINGEFMEADSIQFADSLKFVTPGGKVVYGGGGIMPDVFVSIDTIGITNYFRQVRNKGLMYRFAFEYVDKNRDKLIEYTNAEIIEAFLDSQNLLSSFVDYASENGVPKNAQDLLESKHIIHTEIKAYIARNMIDNKGFYPIWNNIDYTFNQAIEYLSMESFNNQ